MVDYVRFKALRLTTVLDSDWADLSAEAKSLANDVSYAIEWRKQLVSDLKVQPQAIDNAERSVAELAYANVLQRHASVDDWFDLHVILIPCLWVGYTLPNG